MKRFIPFFLSAVLVFQFPLVTLYAAEEAASDLYSYIPIRNAVETSGGNIDWNPDSREVTVNIEGTTYVYNTSNLKELNYKKGSETHVLSAPLVNQDGKIYINYDDIAFVYENENDSYSTTKKETVLYAYDLMKETNVPGITLSFVDYENNYVWVQGFGYADLENQKPVNGKTLFNIASISKVFTATAAMQLVEQGKMKLDGKINDYIPEFKINPHPVYGGNPDEITVEMIMTHLSGLPGDVFDGFYTIEDYDPTYMNNLVDHLSKEYMSNKQMQRSSYSNAAISLLGVIIARVSGESTDAFSGFANYTDQNLFDKMGMNMSSFYRKDANSPYIAKSYKDSESGQQDALYLNGTPCGGLFTNAEDMTQYMGFILNKGTMDGETILTAQSVDKMLTPVDWEMKMNPELNIGMVWMTYNYKGVNLVGHPGDVEYFHSDLELVPEEKLGVFVSANSSSSSGVPNVIAAKTLVSAYSQKTGKALAAVSPRVTKDIVSTKEAVEKYLGRYTLFGEVTCDEDGTIHFPDFQVSYKPQDDGTFYSQAYDSRFRFETINGNDVIIDIAYNNTETVVSEKINPHQAEEDFNVWIGEYTAVSDYNNNAPMIKGLKFSINENGYAAFSAGTINSKDGEHSAASAIEKIDQDTYYLVGTSRGLGSVITRYEKDGKSYVHYSGVDFVKK